MTVQFSGLAVAESLTLPLPLLPPTPVQSMYLYLLDLILNPLDGVAIDVIPGIHLLLTHCFGSDHCKAQRQGCKESPHDQDLGSAHGSKMCSLWEGLGR